MKKLMLIGATIVAGLIAYVSLYSYVDTEAGAGKTWSYGGNPGVTGQEGIYTEINRTITPSGEVTSISFTCAIDPNQLCWVIINDGKTFRSFGLSENTNVGEGYLPSGSSGSVETDTTP